MNILSGTILAKRKQRIDKDKDKGMEQENPDLCPGKWRYDKSNGDEPSE
jgi:hypothetical protein